MAILGAHSNAFVGLGYHLDQLLRIFVLSELSDMHDLFLNQKKYIISDIVRLDKLLNIHFSLNDLGPQE